jgi:hypothetical protein
VPEACEKLLSEKMIRRITETFEFAAGEPPKVAGNHATLFRLQLSWLQQSQLSRNSKKKDRSRAGDPDG